MSLEDRAKRLYPSNPYYQTSWLRSVAFLRRSWVLYHTIERKS